MKFFTFLTAMLFASIITNAQEMPCPDFKGLKFVTVDPAPNCTGKVEVTASSSVPTNKSLSISVFEGSNITGTLIWSECFTILANAADTVFTTSVFNYTCGSALTFVIRRFTASNSTCSGGECGPPTIRSTGPDGAPTPVKLGAFTGVRKGNSVELKWRAESEIDASEYQVERNTGNGFTKINTVPTKNSVTATNYAITDNNASAKISEYRLKMVDKDGTFKYSNIVSIKGTGAASDFTVYPNPISKGSTAVVKITDITDATTLSVIDYTGRLVKQLPTNSSTINISNLPAGSYLIRISNSKTGGNTTQKLAVAN